MKREQQRHLSVAGRLVMLGSGHRRAAEFGVEVLAARPDERNDVAVPGPLLRGRDFLLNVAERG